MKQTTCLEKRFANQVPGRELQCKLYIPTPTVPWCTQEIKMRHATNLPQNPKKGMLLWHWGQARRVHRDAGTWSAENISRWFKFFKGSLDGYFFIKKKCLKCFNTKIMYKMFLKICKSGHLKIFKSIQLR